jgi:hypothetical protein
MGLDPLDFLACFALLDGTARKICRPTGAYHYQRSVYDGHHRLHGFDYQAVMTPDGIIWQLFGPVSARHTDSWMVSESKLLDLIKRVHELLLFVVPFSNADGAAGACEWGLGQAAHWY